jgi:hypothetical protein
VFRVRRLRLQVCKNCEIEKESYSYPAKNGLGEGRFSNWDDGGICTRGMTWQGKSRPATHSRLNRRARFLRVKVNSALKTSLVDSLSKARKPGNSEEMEASALEMFAAAAEEAEKNPTPQQFVIFAMFLSTPSLPVRCRFRGAVFRKGQQRHNARIAHANAPQRFVDLQDFDLTAPLVFAKNQCLSLSGRVAEGLDSEQRTFGAGNARDADQLEFRQGERWSLKLLNFR